MFDRVQYMPLTDALENNLHPLQNAAKHGTEKLSTRTVFTE